VASAVNDRRVLNGIFWMLRSMRHGVTSQQPMVTAPLARLQGAWVNIRPNELQSVMMGLYQCFARRVKSIS
jgi:transposase